MLSIALTKGRLEKQSVAMFEQCGYGIEDLKNKGRQLVFHDSKKEQCYFLGQSRRLRDLCGTRCGRCRLCWKRYFAGI